MPSPALSALDANSANRRNSRRSSDRSALRLSSSNVSGVRRNCDQIIHGRMIFARRPAQHTPAPLDELAWVAAACQQIGRSRTRHVHALIQTPDRGQRLQLSLREPAQQFLPGFCILARCEPMRSNALLKADESASPRQSGREHSRSGYGSLLKTLAAKLPALRSCFLRC